MQDNLLIKSIDRDSGTSDDFKVHSSVVLEGTYLLKHAIIPNTIYNVNETNNKFQLWCEGLGEVVYMTFNITLPLGNYTPTTFASMLASTMSAVGLNFATYTVTIDPATNVLSIATTDERNFKLNFTWRDTIYVRQLFGVAQDVIETEWLPVFTGTSIINLGSPESIGVVIEQSSTKNFENISTDCVGTLYIPLDKAFGSYVALSSDYLPQRLHFTKRERYLRIRVIDTSTHETRHLNGGEYELLLSKEC